MFVSMSVRKFRTLITPLFVQKHARMKIESGTTNPLIESKGITYLQVCVNGADTLLDRIWELKLMCRLLYKLIKISCT